MNFLMNLFSSIMTYLSIALLSLWLTPFIIKNLGIEAYGMIPLIQTSINYVVIITMAFSSMTGRFYTVAKTQNKLKEAQEYISTTFYTMVIICCILFIAMLAFISEIDLFFNIPSNLVTDTKLLFLFQGLSFIFLAFNIPFQAIPYAENKLYINSVSNMAGTVIRILIIVSVMNILSPQIWHVGLAATFSSLLVFIIGYFVYKKLSPINIKIESFKFIKLKEMLILGSWQSVNYAGSLFYLQIDILIANLNLGPLMGGVYATLAQWSSLIRALGNAIGSIFSPTYVRLYALNATNELVASSRKAILFVGIVIGIMSGFIGGMSSPLLSIWLGIEFQEYSHVLLLISIALGINVCVSPLFSLLSTYKKVKIPAVMQIFVGVLNVILAFIVTGYLNLGMIGLAVTSLITYSIINIVFMPIYISNITNQKISVYYSSILKSILCYLIALFICYVYQIYIYVNSWLTLFIGGVICLVTYLIICVTFILNREEKNIIYKYIEKNI